MPPETERPAEPAAAPHVVKLPPFKRGAPASIVLPAITLAPAPAANADPASAAPSTLLFNDVSDDAPMCDPNDPDCELV